VESSRNVLITGGSGLLASLWANTRKDKDNLLFSIHSKPIHNNKFSGVHLNLRNPNEISKFLDENNIEILVNTIGYTNVDKAKDFEEKASIANIKIPTNLAIACSQSQVKLIHISTDHLYGHSNKFYTENDMVELLNIYAKTKYIGENSILEINHQSLICRTNFFGNGFASKPSFSDRIISSLKQNMPIELFQDVFFTPVIGSKLADYAHRLIEIDCFGVYNISSDNAVSKYQFGLFIANEFSFDSKLIKKGFINSRKDLAVRPTAMALSNRKASQALGHTLGTVFEHIRLLKCN
tara:strand:- start:58 stop:942 length:885 start_codon:yes stop_codon:yes gene_type:complete